MDNSGGQWWLGGSNTPSLAQTVSKPAPFSYTPGMALPGDALSYLQGQTGQTLGGALQSTNGYTFAPVFSGGSSSLANPGGDQQFSGIGVNDGKQWYQGQNEYKYGSDGTYNGFNPIEDPSKVSWVDKYGPYIPLLFAGGAAALAGAGGAAAGGAAASTAAGTTASADLAAGAGLGFGAPMGADAVAAYGGMAGAVTPAAMAGAMGMTPEAFAAMGEGGLGAAGAANGMLDGTAAPLTGVPPPAAPGAPGLLNQTVNIPGLGNMSVQQLGGLGSTLTQLLGGNSGSGTGGATGSPSTGGLNLGSITQALGGINDSVQQNQAASTMKSWMDAQQAKVDNLYAPGSAEYNSLWDQMSRLDAKAGRNSQYGPRSVDLAARIAQIKADDTAKMTTGLAPAYSAALNQKANANSLPGLMAALGQGGVNGTTVQNLSSILNGLSSGTANNMGGGITMNPDGTYTYSSGLGIGGSSMSNADIMNSIGYSTGDPNAIADWWN